MRVALTGGATGIGACVAAKLKERGAEVVAFDLYEPKQNIDRWVKVDLSDPISIAAAVDQVDGTFDALINNAGLPPRVGMAKKVLEVNYFGLKHFAEAMLDKLALNASIVNTASRAGSMWREHLEQVKALMALESKNALDQFIEEYEIDDVRAYNLSKEAVIVKTFADTERMLKRNLRVNSVSPAAVSTGILDDFKVAFGDRVNKSIARAGRAGEPDEIAETIVFLASRQSSWIKGQDITVDGGMTAMAMCEAMNITT